MSVTRYDDFVAALDEPEDSRKPVAEVGDAGGRKGHVHNVQNI
jgi:hypothetical protein